jgi:hypothetical protein
MCPCSSGWVHATHDTTHKTYTLTYVVSSPTHTVAAADAQASAVYSTGGNAALMANRLAELGIHAYYTSRLASAGT